MASGSADSADSTPSTADTQREIEAASQAWEINEQNEYQQDNLALLLRTYYQRLFPYKLYFQWLNYGPVSGPEFQNREFSFTLQNDVYIRYQSFKDYEELRTELLRLCPVKIDIGAVYNAKPKDKKTLRQGAFQPLTKELVFDIDMTDYDEVRTCCDICLKCWDFMTIAIKIIDRALRVDFGFTHLLWVYSGRRGVHCWVCDERARQLSGEERKAVIGWLEVVKGGMQKIRKVRLPHVLPPSLQRAMQIIDEHFEETILRKQGVLDDPTHWRKVLDIVGDDDIRQRMDMEWMVHRTDSVTRWRELLGAIEASAAAKRNKRSIASVLERDIKIQYTYPRLDDKVTTQLNHLLKSPFCVHPKTGRVCVPIVAAECESFNPLRVPTINDVLQELNTYDVTQLSNSSRTSQRKVTDIDKTSLKPYVRIFKDFVAALAKDVVHQADDMEF